RVPRGAATWRINVARVICGRAADDPECRTYDGDSAVQDGECAGGQHDVVVGGQSGAIGDDGGDGVGAGLGRTRIAGAAISDVQRLIVDAGAEARRQIGSQAGRIAVGLRIVADAVVDGHLSDGYRTGSAD